LLHPLRCYLYRNPFLFAITKHFEGCSALDKLRGSIDSLSRELPAKQMEITFCGTWAARSMTESCADLQEGSARCLGQFAPRPSQIMKMDIPN
jgi:hypothetical protein